MFADFRGANTIPLPPDFFNGRSRMLGAALDEALLAGRDCSILCQRDPASKMLRGGSFRLIEVAN